MKKSTGIDPLKFVEELQKFGCGEIIINSIDKDGQMKGYDLDLIEKVRERTNLPMTVMGGAGPLQNIENIINKHRIIDVAAGSLFAFRGTYKAVLINYPTQVKKKIRFLK